MALSDEEKATLEALTAKAKEPDPESDFEIEIYDGSRGARLPYSRGRTYLQEHFGIDLDPDPGKTEGDNGQTGKRDTKLKTSEGGGKESEAQGYWTKRSAANRDRTA